FEQRFLVVRGAEAVVAPVGNDEATRIDLFGEHFRGQGVLEAGRLTLACSLEADDVAFLGSGPSANEQGEAKCKQLCARHGNPSPSRTTNPGRVTLASHWAQRAYGSLRDWGTGSPNTTPPSACGRVRNVPVARSLSFLPEPSVTSTLTVNS